MVHPVYKGHLDPLVPRDHKVRQELQEHKVHLESGAHKVKLVLQDRKAR
jgi:hypothetical protein